MLGDFFLPFCFFIVNLFGLTAIALAEFELCSSRVSTGSESISQAYAGRIVEEH